MNPDDRYEAEEASQAARDAACREAGLCVWAALRDGTQFADYYHPDCPVHGDSPHDNQRCRLGRPTQYVPTDPEGGGSYHRHTDDRPVGTRCLGPECKERRNYPWEYRRIRAVHIDPYDDNPPPPEIIERRAPGQVTDRRQKEERRKDKAAEALVDAEGIGPEDPERGRMPPPRSGQDRRKPRCGSCGAPITENNGYWYHNDGDERKGPSNDPYYDLIADPPPGRSEGRCRRGQEPSQPAQLPRNFALRAQIEGVLRRYRLQHTYIGDDDRKEHLPLVDALTPPDENDVSLGIEEIELLADEIAYQVEFQSATEIERLQGDVARYREELRHTGEACDEAHRSWISEGFDPTEAIELVGNIAKAHLEALNPERDDG